MERHRIDDGAVAVEEIGAEGAGRQRQFHAKGKLLVGTIVGWSWRRLRAIRSQIRFVAHGLRLSSGGCLNSRGGATALAGLGRLHLQRIVEAVEIVEEADGAEQFDDLALGIEAAQLGELLVADGVGVARDGLGEAQRGLFGRGEVVALGPVGQVSELVVGPAQIAGENGVAGQAVWASEFTWLVRTMISSFSLVETVPVLSTAAKCACMVAKISGRWAITRNMLGTLPRWAKALS